MGRYIRGGNYHGTITVIVCFDLHVCQCMVFRIYRAMALSLATPGVQQSIESMNRGSAQARPKQALHDTSIYIYIYIWYVGHPIIANYGHKREIVYCAFSCLTLPAVYMPF